MSISYEKNFTIFVLLRLVLLFTIRSALSLAPVARSILGSSKSRHRENSREFRPAELLLQLWGISPLISIPTDLKKNLARDNYFL